jgi:RNA polymerase sigma factor for flagellar operon FliA
MTPEEFYHQSLEALPPILRGLGREKRLSPEEVEDLRSDVQVKLLEDDYRVLRRWDRRSSLRVYLATVVYNIWHDRVRGEKGNVRVSAAAERLGPPAPELEVLLGRQKLTLDEAYQVINPRFPSLSRSDVEKIATQINPRPGRQFEREDVVARQPDLEPTAIERLEQREKLVKKRKALALLHQRLSELPEQDRLLLVRAHAEGVKFSCIARSLGIDQPPLYRRNERLLTKLRTDLEEAGIRWEDLREVLGIDEPPETGPGERAGADLSQARFQGTLDSGE